MKHHTHAAGGISPMSRCRVPETGAPPFPARTVWQHVAQHSTQGPQREKGQLALWPPGEGISSRSWDRPLPGLSSSTRPYPGQKSCHNVSSAGWPFGATRFAKIWSPPAEGGARPHQARQNPLQRHRGANSKLQRGHATASNRPRASKPCLLPDRMHSLTLGGLPGRGKGSKPVARR